MPLDTADRLKDGRSLTERAGGIFKNVSYKAMKDFDCQSDQDWRDLVDVTFMTRNWLSCSNLCKLTWAYMGSAEAHSGMAQRPDLTKPSLSSLA